MKKTDNSVLTHLDSFKLLSQPNGLPELQMCRRFPHVCAQTVDLWQHTRIYSGRGMTANGETPPSLLHPLPSSAVWTAVVQPASGVCPWQAGTRDGQEEPRAARNKPVSLTAVQTAKREICSSSYLCWRERGAALSCLVPKTLLTGSREQRNAASNETNPKLELQLQMMPGMASLICPWE